MNDVGVNFEGKIASSNLVKIGKYFLKEIRFQFVNGELKYAKSTL